MTSKVGLSAGPAPAAFQRRNPSCSFTHMRIANTIAPLVHAEDSAAKRRGDAAALRPYLSVGLAWNPAS